MKLNDYNENLINALVYNYENMSLLYEGKEGALRLAREYAYGLKDFNVKCQDDIVLKSYMDICCRFYQCEPPIKMNDWASEISIVLNSNN